MNLYEIHIPELDAYVKFKVLTPDRIESFVAATSELSKESFRKKVLEAIVFNLKTDVYECLRKMSKMSSLAALEALYNGSVAFNPGLDIDTWIANIYANVKVEKEPDIDAMISKESAIVKAFAKKTSSPRKSPNKKINKSKFLNLEKYLKERVIGQNEAINAVVSALKRSQAGLNDTTRPLGVFLFAGSSGVGKTHLARELHNYLFGDQFDIIRIDCGEYQHKHENQKLIGSPAGYVGHDDGGYLTNKLVENPDTVVLLDEVEKAHPDIWNTFLRVFDEGMLTDNKGREVSFRNSIIIMTTNLGNDKVVEALTGKGVGFETRTEMAIRTTDFLPRGQVERLANESIKRTFRPEFLNRIDQLIVFNHLSNEDYARIAELELQTVDDKLAKRGTSLKFDDTAIHGLITQGVDTVRGARGMAQVRREQIENKLADIILSSRCPRGTIFELTYPIDKFEISIRRPTRNTKETVSKE
jgi:ATP-dependent Clp protease ATP-binding subunit ClpC